MEEMKKCDYCGNHSEEIGTTSINTLMCVDCEGEYCNGEITLDDTIQRRIDVTKKILLNEYIKCRKERKKVADIIKDDECLLFEFYDKKYDMLVDLCNLLVEKSKEIGYDLKLAYNEVK